MCEMGTRRKEKKVLTFSWPGSVWSIWFLPQRFSEGFLHNSWGSLVFTFPFPSYYYRCYPFTHFNHAEGFLCGSGVAYTASACDVLVGVRRGCLGSSATMTQRLFFFFPHHSFFQDGLKAAENLAPFIEKLAASVHTVNTQELFFLVCLSTCCISVSVYMGKKSESARVSTQIWYYPALLWFQKNNCDDLEVTHTLFFSMVFFICHQLLGPNTRLKKLLTVKLPQQPKPPSLPPPQRLTPSSSPHRHKLLLESIPRNLPPPLFPHFQKMKLKASFIFIPSLMHTYFSNHTDWIEHWKQTVNCDTGSVRGFSGCAWAERRPAQTCQTSAWRRKFRQNLCYGSREKKKKKKAEIFDLTLTDLFCMRDRPLCCFHTTCRTSWVDTPQRRALFCIITQSSDVLSSHTQFLGTK